MDILSRHKETNHAKYLYIINSLQEKYHLNDFQVMLAKDIIPAIYSDNQVTYINSHDLPRQSGKTYLLVALAKEIENIVIVEQNRKMAEMLRLEYGVESISVNDCERRCREYNKNKIILVDEVQPYFRTRMLESVIILKQIFLINRI